MLLRESVFLKSECKSTNKFLIFQIIQGKSSKFNTILTLNYKKRIKTGYFRHNIQNNLSFYRVGTHKTTNIR